MKVQVKSDNRGVDIANVKMSMKPFDEIAIEEAVHMKEKGVTTDVIHAEGEQFAHPRAGCGLPDRDIGAIATSQSAL